MVAANPDKICDTCDCKATSQTFFSIRPPFQLGSPERLTMFRDRLNVLEDGKDGTFQAVIFGGRSTKTNRIARYFLPDCKTTLRVTEQQQSDTDILANQLNIFTQNGDFDSVLSFCPRHSFVGIGLNYKQTFYEYCDDKSLWFSISVPIYNVRNDLNFAEEINNDGGGASLTDLDVVANATCAFHQASWRYGRIEPCKQSITRLGDVELTLGYEVVKREDCFLESFLGILAPAGNKPKAVHVFEPIVGYNKHAAIFFGSSLHFDVWRDCSEVHMFSMAFDFNGQYFLRRTERRSMDLKLKPWSRYMQVYCNEAQAQQASDIGSRSLSTAGINVFTQKVRVFPGFTRVINLAMIYDWCDKLEIEGGYNFFAREAECVKLDCPFRQGIALKALRGQGYTNDVQQIGNVFGDVIANAPNDTALADYSSNILTEDDLDFESASHPCTIEHTLYLYAGRKWDNRCHPLFAGLGTSYQFSESNIGMNRWEVWAKFGVSF